MIDENGHYKCQYFSLQSVSYNVEISIWKRGNSETDSNVETITDTRVKLRDLNTASDGTKAMRR